MKATAKFYGWKLTGMLEACEDCQMSNAQQKNGKTLDIQLEDYKHAPEFDVCLFSLVKAIEKG
jgi:hypothetical protein